MVDHPRAHRVHIGSARRGQVDTVVKVPPVFLDSRANEVFILSGVALLLSGQT